MTKVCPKCDYKRTEYETAPEWQCPNCQGVYEKLEKAIKAGVDVKQRFVNSPASAEQLQMRKQHLVVTTTPTVPGREIEQVIDIVATHSTYAFSSLNEMFGSIGRAFVGSGKSYGTEGHLAKCRAEALESLRHSAATIGADAVVGTEIQIAEFSGATDNGVIVVSAIGTAVTLLPR
ncbi:MAG: heavy metal-binding domain-containing protein [Zhongshania sp.]|uniref:heavy metal-binding domain-containing protein n=1 Tax=Zhongshania sp. TaxID=1971902 RepID=UPI00262E6F4A|nr:heavy metal-binding domain-containing protein [Zhongshania sp.]MDF1691752.1 heavy metal-binding domain-containing protein [Zhongshania sp.]